MCVCGCVFVVSSSLWGWVCAPSLSLSLFCLCGVALSLCVLCGGVSSSLSYLLSGVLSVVCVCLLSLCVCVCVCLFSLSLSVCVSLSLVVCCLFSALCVVSLSVSALCVCVCVWLLWCVVCGVCGWSEWASEWVSSRSLWVVVWCVYLSVWCVMWCVCVCVCVCCGGVVEWVSVFSPWRSLGRRPRRLRRSWSWAAGWPVPPDWENYSLMLQRVFTADHSTPLTRSWNTAHWAPCVPTHNHSLAPADNAQRAGTLALTPSWYTLFARFSLMVRDTLIFSPRSLPCHRHMTADGHWRGRGSMY